MYVIFLLKNMNVFRQQVVWCAGCTECKFLFYKNNLPSFYNFTHKIYIKINSDFTIYDSVLLLMHLNYSTLLVPINIKMYDHIQ